MQIDVNGRTAIFNGGSPGSVTAEAGAQFTLVTRNAAHLAALGCVLAFALLGASAARAADSDAPDYVVINLHVQVNRPAAQVWKRVGDFCAIGEWLKETCRYRSGLGDVGTVREINASILEPMVAKTAWSYAYWQSAGNLAPTSYHGAVAIEPDGKDKSILTYTLFYNQAVLPTAAVRDSERARLTARFQGALDTMKALAEAQP